MPWPLSQDYNEVIQSPETSFADPELRGGEVAVNAMGMPAPCSGNFADVYRVNCAASQRSWAVKCFTREIPGLQERYQQIGLYLAEVKLPFMVDFTFLDQGIKVRGTWYPVLKMQWVEGFTLNHFVRDNLDKPQLLKTLCHIWLKLASRLREARLAHCDLQHGNILLVPSDKSGSLSVKLVDYDAMCVPALTLLKSLEAGHPAYQHPQRAREGIYSLEVDRFPHLVIYTALRALMVGGRALWERYDNGDNLLFTEKDFRSPRDSALFKELVKLNDPDVPGLVDKLSRSAYKPLDQTPLLETLVATPPAPPPATPKVKETPRPQAGKGPPPVRKTASRAERPVVPAFVAGPVVAATGLAGRLFARARRTLELVVAGLCLAGAGFVLVLALKQSLQNQTDAQAAADLLATAQKQEEAAKNEQKKVDDGKREAAEALKQAEVLKAAAAQDRARAEDAPTRAAKLLQQAKLSEEKTALAAEQLKQQQAKLDRQKEQTDAQLKTLALEQAKAAEIFGKLELSAKQVEDMKEELAQQRKQAEVEQAKAKAEVEQAAQKEKEAKQHLQKVEELLGATRLKLKSAVPAERLQALQALGRVADLVPSADRDLCERVVFDTETEVRQEALAALEKVKPKLYKLAATLTEAPAKDAVGGYLQAIKGLPEFGRAGVPLIAAQLQGLNPGLIKMGAASIRKVGDAHAEALAKIAPMDDEALKLLLTLPNSKLAASIDSEILRGNLRREVGNQLLAVGKANPETRKAIAEYFAALLQSGTPESAPDRLLWVKTLADLGPDAALAMPVLKKLQGDPSQQVRAAVKDAIAKIEKGRE